MTLLIDFCLLVNLVFTMAAFVLHTEPEMVIRWVRRRGGEERWFEPPEVDADTSGVVRLWGQFMWGVVVAWGVLTGFLIGLYWQGWFWRF